MYYQSTEKLIVVPEITLTVDNKSYFRSDKRKSLTLYYAKNALYTSSLLCYQYTRQ